MAVCAIQPSGVGAMRKSDEWHFLGVSHDYILVQDVHFFRAQYVSARCDGPRTNRRHPVWKSKRVTRQVPRSIVNALQLVIGRISFVIDRTLIQCTPCRMDFFRRRCDARWNRLNRWRNIRGRHESCQLDTFRGDSQCEPTGKHQQNAESSCVGGISCRLAPFLYKRHFCFRLRLHIPVWQLCASSQQGIAKLLCVAGALRRQRVNRFAQCHMARSFRLAPGQ